MDKNYEKLLFAVVNRACRDYVNAVCKLHNHDIKKHILKPTQVFKYEAMKKECELYIHGIKNRYGLDIDSNVLMDRLHNDIQNHGYEYKKIMKVYNKLQFENYED